MSPLQTEEIFACLDRRGVRYVLIGGLAGVLHGSPLPTLDADICPSREPQNLERLAAALEELDARIRTPDSPEGVRFPRDAAFLADVELLNLMTRFGDLDLAFKPAGTEGFADLVSRAVLMTIRGLTVAVASLEDLIRSKEAANRPKESEDLAGTSATIGRNQEAALLEEMVNRGHVRLGDAVLAGQAAYAETGAFPELLSIYHLLGDPTLRLR